MLEELFNKIIIGWIFLGVVVFFINLKVVAPYGRHASKKWGLLINNRLAWIIMESPALLIVLYLMLPKIATLNIVVWILFFLFIAHYVHRTFIFPFKIKGGGKKMPFGVILLAIIFNVLNGFFIGYYLSNYSQYEFSWLYSLPFLFGAVLFMIGVFINWRADTILFSLREKGFIDYKIPRGFLFEKVSCPNHLGEMIEWLGYAMMSFNFAGLAFAIWTMANLIPRALAHHKWYSNYFEEYPKNRKAFLPGIW